METFNPAGRCYSLSFEMIRSHRNLGIVLSCFLLLVSCASPGPPLPPSLEVARPVRDLRAVRKGNTVTLTWTASTTTTDHHNFNFRHAGPTEICRASASMQQCGTPIAKLPPEQSHGTDAAMACTFTDTLSNFSTTPDAKFVYAVELLNSYGRSAGVSNQVDVPAVPTLPAPLNFTAELRGDGVHLSWSPASGAPDSSGLAFIYRIYRRQADANGRTIPGEIPVRAGEPPAFLDSSIEWEKTYDYQITIVTEAAESHGEHQVEGDDSPEVKLVAHDVFPPATPSGLQAVFSGPGQKPFIDLIWAPDTDADLAGYSIYRSEEGGEPRKINADPAKSPAFRDNDVVPGHAYTYFVSAVDVRGNESSHSEPAEEKVPEE